MFQAMSLTENGNDGQKGGEVKEQKRYELQLL
jgi:hypothetical protein